MDKETIELWNTNILKTEFVKNVTHFFCAAVLHECEYACNNDFNRACGEIFDTLYRVSHNNSDIGIKPITHNDNLLEYFFNQKNEIPAYVFYWLQYC
ncbi:MAG: hypothetical protein ACI4A5_01455 [Hominilimicola sp.]